MSFPTPWPPAAAALSRIATIAGTPVEVLALGILLGALLLALLYATYRRSGAERRANEMADFTAERRSERQFRALIENAADIVSVLDADGTVRYHSPAIHRVLGFAPEVLVGTSVFSGAHDEDRDAVVATFERTLAKPGAIQGCVFRNRHIDGGWRFLEVTATNLLDDPAVAGVVVNSRDVTERHLAEDALRLQTAYHEQLFEGAPEGIVMLDAGDRILRANAEFVRMFGLEGEELRGRTINSLIVPPEHHAEALGYTHAAGRGERVAAEGIRMRLDGTPVEVSILATPVRLGGEAIAVYGIYRDITERKRAEDALRRREKQLAQAQQMAHIGSWEFDFPTATTIWSDELWRIFGLDPGSCVPSYERFLRLIHPDDCVTVREHLERGVDTASTVNLEFRIVRPDGSERVVGSRMDAITDGRGTLLRLIGTTQDLTEWKQLEEQFRQSQKMEAVGRLAGGIAHDFNNLLTGIKGHADLLLMDLPEHSEFREDVVEIEKAADRAAGLTSQLLAYSRRQVMQPRAVDLNAIVESSSAMLRRLVGEHIDFRTRLAPDLGAVRADPVQLAQVLMNLVVNARDAMPAGGTLTIATHNLEPCDPSDGGDRTERCAVLSVVDTGHGMDADTLSRIFEPFFTTKALGKGTGLGLSTAYGIVQQSGGEIVVDSVSGDGTSFEVRFPCLADEGPAVAPPPDGDPRPDSPAPATILVVEDEDGVRDLVRRMLERAGHRPLVARDGEEALLILARHASDIDLMISDVVMPGMSGPTLAERTRDLLPGLRVVFMSGYTDAAIERPGGLGEDALFLQKPFTPDELAAIVGRALARTSG